MRGSLGPAGPTSPKGTPSPSDYSFLWFEGLKA